VLESLQPLALIQHPEDVVRDNGEFVVSTSAGCAWLGEIRTTEDNHSILACRTLRSPRP